MEDRIADGLYLEMTDRAPSTLAAERVPTVLVLPGATRATVFKNLKPDREEFPRSIPEFRTLLVTEVDPHFEAPATPDDIRGYHFRRFPRPGQGTLSGKPTLGLELVLVSPRTPEGAAALRDWADFLHIREIAAANVPGFTMITLYENVVAGASPRFMHFYEMDTGDAESAFQEMAPRTLERIRPRGRDAVKQWVGHSELVIDYVNTFARVGEAQRAAL